MPDVLSAEARAAIALFPPEKIQRFDPGETAFPMVWCPERYEIRPRECVAVTPNEQIRRRAEIMRRQGMPDHVIAKVLGSKVL